MKVNIILAIILIGILTLIFGFNKVPENCDCKGLGSQTCFGKIVCENNISACIPITCENKEEFFGNIDLTQDKNRAYTILIIDASKSMEGENLDATIKASKSFVQKIGEQEYLAVIEFNEKAQILTDFTNEKITLYKSIDLIFPKKRTRFYEPFMLANKLFEDVPINANKYILFLSDGAPEDDKELFLNEVNKLKKNNVNTYTLAFAGKSNEELMKEIASTNSNIFTVTTSADIEEKFIQIYSTISNERDLKISLIKQPEVIKNTDNILAKITSAHNGKNIFNQEKYCELKSATYLEARNTKKQFSRIPGEIVNGEISFPLIELNSGDYDITIYSKIQLDSYTINTKKNFGTIKILKETDCQISCSSINAAMKGINNHSYQRNNTQSTSWNILIDTSSSMDKNKYLEKAINDVKTITSYLPTYDTISIGSFDRKVNLIEIHTPKYLLNTSTLNAIVPTFSTQIITALQKFKELEVTAPSKTIHHIIISDGDYLNEQLSEIKIILQTIKGCITTVNYGTHLLTHDEEAFELIKKYRNCGTDFITQPTKKEFQTVIGTTLKNEPELVISFIQESTNVTTLTPQIISTFTGTTPIVKDGDCNIQPHISTTIMREHEGSETVTDRSFKIGNEDSFISIATFGNKGCFYETTKQYQQPIEEKSNNTLKIVAAVLIVLSIHLVVFTFVMKKKLKNLKKIRSKQRKQ